MVRAPQADSTATRLIQDVVGNKADAAITVASSTASLVAYLKGLLSRSVVANDYQVVTKSVSPTTQGATNLFTATGLVELAIMATTEAAVTSGGTPTLEVGVTGSTALFVAQIANATGLAADEIYAGTTAVKGAAVPGFKLLNDASAILTLGGADLTAGTLKFYAMWRPIEAGATLVAA